MCSGQLVSQLFKTIVFFSALWNLYFKGQFEGKELVLSLESELVVG